MMNDARTVSEREQAYETVYVTQCCPYNLFASSLLVTVIPYNIVCIERPTSIISESLISSLLLSGSPLAVSPQRVWLQRHRLVSMARPPL